MTNTNDNWDKLFEQLPLDTTPDEKHREELKSQLIQQYDSQSLATVNKSKLNQTIETIMKYKIPQWVTVASVLVAFAVWFSQSDSPALAAEDVVAHIMKANNARWDMIVQNEGNPDQKISVHLAPSHSRQEFENGMVVVVDWNQGQCLGLMADQKLAMRFSAPKVPGSGMKHNHFEKMRGDLRQAMADGKVEELGEKQFDERTLVGFRFKPQSLVITIWADPVTGFPVRIENDIPGPRTSRVLMVNYKFNVEMDPSLFSLEIPEGYKLMESNTPDSSAAEQK